MRILILIVSVLIAYSGISQDAKYNIDSVYKGCGYECKQYVKSFVAEITDQSSTWQNALKKFCHYHQFLDSLLIANGLPLEFKVLPLTSSLMNPSYSDSFNRTGCWNLSLVDALSFNLTVDFVVDERRDFIKSSFASVKKLRALYNKWKDVDSTVLYFFLQGPAVHEEERQYAIAKWLAWKLTKDMVFNQLQQHCGSYNNKDSKLVVVKADTTLFFDCISRFCKKAFNIKDLNPVYYRGIVLKGNSFYIHQEAKDCFDSVYLKIVKCSSGHYDREKVPVIYKVRYGDNLSKIARRYGVTVRDIMRWNKLRSTRIYAGQKLVIYVSRNRVSAKSKHQMSSNITKNNKASKYTGKKKIYIVREGDTLFDIAKKHNVSLERLMEVNNLSTDVIYPGQEIIIPLE